MARTRNALAVLAAGAAGVGALFGRRRRTETQVEARSPADPAPAGGDAVMTYSSPGQVAAFEDQHGAAGLSRPDAPLPAGAPEAAAPDARPVDPPQAATPGAGAAAASGPTPHPPPSAEETDGHVP